tara:strand:+ start:272 stop:1069 length:798 start_codon:yes stop_codon:yes gene_type:complete
MAKYENAYRAELDTEEKPYSEELAEQVGATEAMPLDPEEETFKKRYGDVRKHLSNVTSQKDKEIRELKLQLSSATKKQIKFPKTEEEIDAWSKKYPDVSAIVDTIARKRANEALQEGEKKLASLKDMETRLEKEKAEATLLRMHPDFDDIRQDKAFHEWAALQPMNIQDSLYKNNTDAHAASRAIDLYKIDQGITASKSKKSNSKGIASSIGKQSASRPTSGRKMKFSESSIEKMSPQEYEKFEDQIMEAIQSGEFEYDQSAAAR